MYSVQQEIILGILSGADRPFSAEEIVKALVERHYADASLGSVRGQVFRLRAAMLLAGDSREIITAGRRGYHLVRRIGGG